MNVKTVIALTAETEHTFTIDCGALFWIRDGDWVDILARRGEGEKVIATLYTPEFIKFGPETIEEAE